MVKAKVCVWGDSVLCVGQVKDTPGAIERWKGPVAGLKLFSSCQDAVGIDGEAIEFEWKITQDFHHCLFLKNPRRLGETRRSQPEEFTDQIIFMSMFNDIVMERK